MYVPPYRIQGISVAGEQTVVQIPELDVSFDIGMCPRIALSSAYVALSHGHMDHVGGLPYYFSQRMFQKMGIGKCVCHPDLAEPIDNMMRSWVDLEGQKTPFEIIPLAAGEQIEVKNNIYLRAIDVSHANGSLAFGIVERRSKLRDEYL
ncbi:MAG: MBL fold metallo-hydrolase, partial [Planctomycetota bacterium]